MRHGDTMRDIPTAPAQRVEMLRTIGAADLDVLLAPVVLVDASPVTAGR